MVISLVRLIVLPFLEITSLIAIGIRLLFLHLPWGLHFSDFFFSLPLFHLFNLLNELRVGKDLKFPILSSCDHVLDLVHTELFRFRLWLRDRLRLLLNDFRFLSCFFLQNIFVVMGICFAAVNFLGLSVNARRVVYC